MKLPIALLVGAASAIPFYLPGHGQSVMELDSQDLLHGDKDTRPVIDTEELQKLITAEGLKERAEKLYNISTHSIGEYGHPTRVIGSAGHFGTVGYVIHEMKKLGYKVETQSFSAIDGRVKNYTVSIDGKPVSKVHPLSLTPPTKGEIEAKLVLADNLGCSVSDFEGVTGNIALIKRGECPFGDKSINAGKAGAIGAIIYDQEEFRGSLSSHTGKEIPTVGVKESAIAEVLEALKKDPKTDVPVKLYIDSYVRTVRTLNVVAETIEGDHDNVVSLGAHSDSVANGPGINDDGSGTLSLLEVASKLTQFKVNNAVRFAWWAAEEEGLLGSEWYANHLSAEENAKLRVFMDYDMMASPNYEYQVYDANNEDHPNGSGDLRDLYIDWYTQHGYNYTLVEFDGRSDYVGFIDNGIPAGGIAAGADSFKSKEGVAKYGGVEGEWLDQCYHQLCDDLDNVDYEAWVVNTKLIAHSVATYAKDWGTFPEREVKAKTANGEFKYRGSQLVF